MIDNLKEKIIKAFVKENKRVPSLSETNFLIYEEKKKNPLIEEQGVFANNQKSYFQAGEESSASKMNEKLDDLFLDLKYLNKDIEVLKEKQKSIFSDNFRILESFTKEYKALEKKINLGILLKQENDVFSYEVLEDFVDLEKVDLNKSNIYHLDENKITIGYSKISNFVLSEEETSYSIRHLRGNKLKEEITGSFSNIFLEDNTFFRIESKSTIPDDIVELIIDINFSSPRNVNELKYVTTAIESNGPLIEECYYSLDGANWIHTDSYETGRRVTEDRNSIQIQRDGEEENIKKIRLILRKINFDSEKNGIYSYYFGLDFLGYLNKSYQINKKASLYCGPYEILNEDNEKYNFSLARVDKGTCCEIPDKTSIDLYLSKDNINWIKAEFNKDHNPIIQFENNIGNVTSFEEFSVVDTESSYQFIAENIPENINLKETEALLNIFLSKEMYSSVNLESIKIERNLLNKFLNISNNGIVTGWHLENNYYKCTFDCKIPEGKIIDFGDNEVVLDKVKVKEEVFIKYGTHEISVPRIFFRHSREKEKEFKSEREIKKVMQEYPYNPRYLIEGFEYNIRFKGNKIYTGFQNIRSSILKSTHELQENDVTKYKVIEKEEGKYFVVNKNSFSEKEEYSITYRKNLPDSGNLLYIKAILETNDSRKTPKIDKIQVRIL